MKTLSKSVDNAESLRPSVGNPDRTIKRARPHNLNNKLISQGAHTLSDAELLALLIGQRMAHNRSTAIAMAMLETHGGIRLALNADRQALCAQPGVGNATYARLHAAIEIGRRSLQEKLERSSALTSPDASRDFLTMSLRDKKHESFYVLFLDSKHRVICAKELFRGTIDSTSVPVREVVVEALKHNAAALIVAHNHPSGNSEPSAADRHLTDSLHSALDLVGVRLLDHFVIGEGAPVSFAERGLISR